MIQQAILGAATEVKAAAAAPLWLYDRNDIFLNSCFVDRAARQCDAAVLGISSSWLLAKHINAAHRRR